MQSKDAYKLRQEWGSKPCKHSNIVRLYDMGTQDGYVCAQCGEEHFNKQDFSKIDE